MPLVFTNNKMCTPGIYHTSNGYYSSVMSTRTIFLLQKGQDKPTKYYYRRFEATISMAEIAKRTAMKHTKKKYT